MSLVANEHRDVSNLMPQTHPGAIIVRLATLEMNGREAAVAVTQADSEPQYVDLNAVDDSLPTSVRGILAAENGIARAAAAAEKGAAGEQFVTGTLLAPVPDPSKVICIGLNYRDHAEESGLEIPTEPVVFNKFPQAVIGPHATIRLPAVCKKVDYEAELVAIIGRRGRNISQADARSYIAGYTNGNDVSARDWQIGRPGGQWLMGKTPDTFAPIGPWLVTADEIPDPESLRIRLRVNGETLQDSMTTELIFGLDELVSHLSQLFALEPGDLIFTGTPPGVGAARKPPIFLKPGDTTDVEIDGLGVLTNPVDSA